jgi:autotransporter passenger strand-loop-strand repeat protein
VASGEPVEAAGSQVIISGGLDSGSTIAGGGVQLVQWRRGARHDRQRRHQTVFPGGERRPGRSGGSATVLAGGTASAVTVSSGSVLSNFGSADSTTVARRGGHRRKRRATHTPVPSGAADGPRLRLDQRRDGQRHREGVHGGSARGNLVRRRNSDHFSRPPTCNTISAAALRL